MTKEEREKQRQLRIRLRRISVLFTFCADAEVVEQRRKDAYAHRELMLQYQKQIGKQGDREFAKFFKEEAKEALKAYRGTCLVLAYLLNDPPGDCKVMPPKAWPPELITYAERAAHDC